MRRARCVRCAGYDGFSFDVTEQLRALDNELFVQVYDPSDEGAQPNGKQVPSRSVEHVART
jgi:hypothetical protein